MAEDTTPKNVLVTGSTGFLGRSVIDILKKDASHQIATTDEKLHDLTNFKDCKKVTENIDTIVNLAGLVPSKIEQQERPAEVFSLNTFINLNIAEAARQNNVRRIIFISSVVAYPGNTPSPFVETELWNGPVSDSNYAYGTAKRITETIARAYTDQYGIEVTTLLLPNLYGPRDKFNNTPPPLVPSIIKQIHRATNESTPEIKGGNNGDFELELLYVTDAAKAIISAINTKNLPSVINISNGVTISIKEMYKTVARKIGYKGRIVWEPGKVPAPRLMDNTLAKQSLGWQSQVQFPEGISTTVDDYLKNYTTR